MGIFLLSVFPCQNLWQGFDSECSNKTPKECLLPVSKEGVFRVDSTVKKNNNKTPLF